MKRCNLKEVFDTPVKRVFSFVVAILVSIQIFADGFTPSDGGLVVNLKPNDRIMLSTVVDGVEYFVCDYTEYTGVGHRFSYAAGHTLKLIPAGDLTSVSDVSVWTIDTALVRPYEEQLGGICYTMWSKAGYTILLAGNFKTQGSLTNNKNHANTADVVFVVPTRAATTSFDPNQTLGKGEKFSSVKGFGFLGMPYREVYWLDIPRNNSPKSYTNASLIGFNTTLADYQYPSTGTKETAKSGQALYAFADTKHQPTQRTLFRLYVLDETTVSACPDANYYFAYSQRFRGKFRLGPGTVGGKTKKVTDSTDVKSTITMDLLTCMDSVPGTKYYHTDWMHVPDLDSARYYVGYKNHFPHTRDGAPFEGEYTYMDSLPMMHMPGLKAPTS